MRLRGGRALEADEVAEDQKVEQAEEDGPARRQLYGELAMEFAQYRKHHRGYSRSHQQEIAYWDPNKPAFTKSLTAEHN